MKNRYFLTAIFCLFVILIHADERVRLIIMADMGNEEDEMQQITHMLTCSNEFELEGLIAVTGIFLRPIWIVVNADRIENLAKSSLATLNGLLSGGNRELELTVENLKAMAFQALYSANKYRAAMYLEQDKKDRALKAISIACGYWKNYTNSMDALFKGVTLQRNFDFSDWHVHDADALQDFINLGGELSK